MHIKPHNILLHPRRAHPHRLQDPHHPRHQISKGFP